MMMLASLSIIYLFIYYANDPAPPSQLRIQNKRTSSNGEVYKNSVSYISSPDICDL